MQKNDLTYDATTTQVNFKTLLYFIIIYYLTLFIISFFTRNITFSSYSINDEKDTNDISFNELVLFDTTEYEIIPDIQLNIDLPDCLNSDMIESNQLLNIIPNLLIEEEKDENENNIEESKTYKTAVLSMKTIKPIKKEEIYISLDELSISYDMELNTCTGLSKEDFVTLINDCPYDYTGWFSENAELIYDVCNEYEINEIFFCGLIAAESGWKISSAHRNTHNYISMMGGGGLQKFDSLDEGLIAAAELLSEKYLTEGGCYYHGTDLLSVKKSFCPNSTTWDGLVYGCMNYFVG